MNNINSLEYLSIDDFKILIELLFNAPDPEDEDIIIDLIKKHKLRINKNLHTHPAATNNV